MTNGRRRFAVTSLVLAVILVLGACSHVSSVEDPTITPPPPPATEPSEPTEPTGPTEPSDDPEMPAPVAWSETAIGYSPDELLSTSAIRDGYVLRGSGTDIWDDRDAFYFMYTGLRGDGSIQVRLDDLEQAHEWSKAGVMIRESLDPASRHVLLHTTAENGSVLQAREETGGQANNAGGSDPSARPGAWMRLTREGDRFVGELSRDGETWRELGSYTLGLDDEVLIGLAVTSHAEGRVATATFSDFAFVRGTPDDGGNTGGGSSGGSDDGTGGDEGGTDDEGDQDAGDGGGAADGSDDGDDGSNGSDDGDGGGSSSGDDGDGGGDDSDRPGGSDAGNDGDDGDTAPTPAAAATNWICGDEPLAPRYEPTYFVAPYGNDDSAGSEGRPFRTLQRAANAVDAGDVVWVRGGVYSTNVSFQRSGTADRPIVFESYPGECAILDGSDHAREHHVRFEGASHNVFRNFIVRNSPAQGIHLVDADDNLITNVRTHDGGLSGIQNVSSDRNRFAYFVSHDNYDPQSGGGNADGIGLSSGRGNRIDHCVAYRNSDDGVDTWKSVDSVVEKCIAFENGFRGGDGNGFKAGGDGDTTNTVVRFSLAFGNEMQGFNYNSGRNETFEHNTAYDNGYYGFIAADARLRNNLAYGNERADWQDDGGNDARANSWNLDTGRPGFVSTDPRSPDFLTPSSGSPALDAGVDIGLDVGGRTPDLGALQRGETLASFLGVDLRAILAY